MKKQLIVLLAISCMTISSFAQSTIALHSTDTTIIFSGNSAFADAMTAAQTGDTLYLSGGVFNAVAIDKGVKVFGAGIHPDSTTATYSTLISGDLSFLDNSDGSHFEGIEFANTVRMHYNDVADDISFFRCKFNNSVDFGYSGDPATQRNNFVFMQCIFIQLLDLQGVTSSLVSNCILQNMIFESNSNTIRNNSFLINAGTYGVLRNSNGNIVANNIFHTANTSIAPSGSSSNNFQHNVFTAAAPNLGTTPIDNNNYKSVSMDSIFVSVPSQTFSFDDDYYLKASAQSNFLGDDATQVGVYGGMFPLKDGFVPQNPHISSKNIPSLTDENGMLNVEMNVNAQEE